MTSGSEQPGGELEKTTIGPAPSVGNEDQTQVGPETGLSTKTGLPQITAAPSSSPADPLVGGKLSGCAIDRKLGQGGMGSVYLATRESDGAKVVVKLLASEQSANPTWRARFIREARMMQSVSHPNIVAVYSVDGDSDRPHIVMEFVDGKPLDEVLKGRSFAPMEAAALARDIARGLAEAHKRGIVHRDIKPANVLLTRQGEVKILDFGLAKNVQADEGLTMAGQALGTPHYMAPEQWGEHQVDARCDVYSLGVTLYQLATRQLPFQATSQSLLLRKIMESIFPAPRSVVAAIPEDLQLVIFRMMSADRRYRYPSAEECARDLDRVLASEPVDVPRLVEKETGTRHPLLPAASYTLGRDETCDIPVLDRSVSRQHARVERGATGFVLRDLGSTYGSFVESMKVKDVVLKNGDEVKLGKVAFTFHDGGLGLAAQGTRQIEPDRIRVKPLPAPLVQALIDDADKRTAVALLSELAPDAVERRVRTVRALLRAAIGGDLAETVASKVELRLVRAKARIPAVLFSITRENLGDDVEAWLGWWEQARTTYPPQVAPDLPRPRARLEVVKGENEQRKVRLDESMVFTLGRDEKAQLPLTSQSVSRLHATVLRLHQRLVIRDEGSRFGTLVNGKRVRIAFLCPGDKVTLGKVEMTFEVDPAEPSADEGDATPIDPDAFAVLEEMQHPSICLGLIRFLEAEARFGWIGSEATKLFPSAATQALEFAKRAKAAYAKRADNARKLLPKLLGECPEATPAAWRELLKKKVADLPFQVLPEGWFPKNMVSSASIKMDGGSPLQTG